MKIKIDDAPLAKAGDETRECYLVGGPLNGQRGLIKGLDKVVKLEIYGQAGEIVSVERYALGDNPTPTFRHWAGSESDNEN